MPNGDRVVLTFDLKIKKRAESQNGDVELTQDYLDLLFLYQLYFYSVHIYSWS